MVDLAEVALQHFLQNALDLGKNSNVEKALRATGVDSVLKLAEATDQMINDLQYDDGSGTMIDVLPMPRNKILLAKTFLQEDTFNIREPAEILKISAKDYDEFLEARRRRRATATPGYLASTAGSTERAKATAWQHYIRDVMGFGFSSDSEMALISIRSFSIEDFAKATDMMLDQIQYLDGGIELVRLKAGLCVSIFNSPVLR